MALLMPGETYGIPNAMPQAGGMGGLLTNPALQIGLGILANNNSRNLGQVLGRGALQGMGNLQQAQVFQMQQQQMEQIAKERAARQKLAEQEMKQQELQNQAIENAAKNNPELADLFRIDPKSAIRAAFPQSVDPYFTSVDTEQGLMRFNNRTGQLEPLQINGSTVMRAGSSPQLQEDIARGKARGGADYSINTDIPGQVATTRQVAEQANPQLRVSPQVQGQRDNLRLNILLDEQKQSGGVGANPELDKEIANVQRQLGVRIPTPAEQAAEKITAEDLAKSKIQLNAAIQEADQSIQLVDDLLKAPGFKQAVGGSRLFQVQRIPGTAAADFDIRLDQLKGKQFLQAFESLKGGGQITEIEGRKATEAISRMNPNASEEEFTKAAREFQDIIRKGAERAKAKAGSSSIMPSTEPMPSVNALPLPSKPSTLTLKKGAVYQTPRGNLRWNGKAFEDL